MSGSICQAQDTWYLAASSQELYKDDTNVDGETEVKRSYITDPRPRSR